MQMKKKHKLINWYKQGGYNYLQFVPHTPRGELAKKKRTKEAENNQSRKMRLKIITSPAHPCLEPDYCTRRVTIIGTDTVVTSILQLSP